MADLFNFIVDDEFQKESPKDEEIQVDLIKNMQGEEQQELMCMENDALETQTKETQSKSTEAEENTQENGEKQEEDSESEGGKRYVMNTAIIECQLCTNPRGVLVVTSNQVRIQEQFWATEGDRTKQNLIFMGNCTQSPYSSYPCISVIQPDQWKDVSESLIQDQKALLNSSTIKCNYGGVDITIVDDMQKSVPTNLSQFDESPAPEPAKKVLMVAFSGGPTGGDKVIENPEDRSDLATITKVFRHTEEQVKSQGFSFDGQIITPGKTSSPKKEEAYPFLVENYDKNTTVILYGFSYGVDFAVELSEVLKEQGISVDLLITIDGSDGFLQNWTVNDEIPENVKENHNYYQTAPSSDESPVYTYEKITSEEDKIECDTNDESSGGTTNFPGSHGGPMEAENPEETNVYNYNETGKNQLTSSGELNGCEVSHGGMDEHVHIRVKQKIDLLINSLAEPIYVDPISLENLG